MTCFSFKFAPAASCLAIGAVLLLGCRGSDDTAITPEETVVETNDMAIRPMELELDLSNNTVQAGFHWPGPQRRYTSAADEKRNAITTTGVMSDDKAHLLLTASTEERELVAVKLALTGDTATVKTVWPLKTQVTAGRIVEVRSTPEGEILSLSSDNSLPPGAWRIQLERHEQEHPDPEVLTSDSGND